MSENNKGQQKQASNVIPMGPVRCVSEGCNEKPKRLNFCSEHFEWFKAGLITRSGQKAKDFDKKHQSFIAKHHKKSA